MKSFAQFSEDEIFQFFSNGDNRAFTALYNRYAEVLFIMAMIKLKDKAEANDVVQIAFLALWKRKNTDIRNVKAYLCGTVNMLCKNITRTNFNLRGQQQEYIQLQNISITETPFERKELNQELVIAINMVSPASREAFIKLYIQKKRIKEIAIEMDITVQSVKNHIQRALKILRGHLKKSL
ncbi:RNA polymerase sigma factor, sigma-70 family [Chitinophaga sp. CF118]|uniref:RNA polymerase sigma factor n=1 Tax=Chitinophaga sp. CF118 TaxID=1884367 RepID=UPI0008E81D2C|nr:sigma-70 family RNA polymerase sigma factor [Chitinophaga sp. CF118]SFD20517.1 RNA polymerase sigma factor, sigma-70 family [Chitinophaga sp. CF118]